MLSINCHLANVQMSENADSENVMEIMSELLFGKHLKIVGVVSIKYSWFQYKNTNKNKRGKARWII